MYGDSFFTLFQCFLHKEEFIVFVPMYGDSFFTLSIYFDYCVGEKGKVFVPMYGDSFFTTSTCQFCVVFTRSFRPHVWGFFFHIKDGDYSSFGYEFRFSSPCMGILFSQAQKVYISQITPRSFRPHVWGFFFHMTLRDIIKISCTNVFVPMYGDSFFTSVSLTLLTVTYSSFRPHVWGFFFHSRPGRPHRLGSLLPFCGGDFQLIRILIFFSCRPSIF